MKLSDGFTRTLYSIVTFVGMIASFALLSAAMRTLPLGMAYTIWTGIGAVGSFVAGLYFLGEPGNADAHTRCGGDCSGSYYDETGILRYLQR